MSTFKCKMCGGTLEIQPGQTVAECEYCGTQQTLPKLDDDRRANLYDRANHFRRNNEFDKAMGIYEQILNEDSTDAESYWSLVLCRYGIEYVEDPTTHKRVPTVNRAQFTAVFDDDNYKSAIQYADTYQRSIYEAEAKVINEIQKGILAISQKEEPFDVFICYKETDSNGRRTQDSVLANDLYHQLTQEGFKVFFSRITLEDKLGSAYEPYIFAALNSAKVMVVLGTKPEYFKAVWVKNEWARYLSLIKNGAKKALIPAYKDMDPYDLPEEFSHLQAQDMSKLGFMQDLIRGIKKITQADVSQENTVKETVVAAAGANTAALIKRAYMFLEDGEWDSADEYCERVLDIDPENCEAYLGKALASERKISVAVLVQSRINRATTKAKKLYLEPNREHIDEMVTKYTLPGYVRKEQISDLYKFDLSYSSEFESCETAELEELEYWHNIRWLDKAERYLTGEAARNYETEKEKVFNVLLQRTAAAKKSDEETVAKLEKEYAEHICRADEEAKKLYEKGLQRKAEHYHKLMEIAKNSDDVQQLKNAAEKLQAMGDYQDSKSLSEHCLVRAGEEQAIAEENAYEEVKRIGKKKNRIVIIAVLVICAAFFLGIMKITPIISKNKYDKYNTAISLIDEGKTIEAYETLIALSGYKDSAEKASAIYDAYKLAKLKTAKVGDYVVWGSYEQDNNTSNGKEEIEWLVLSKSDSSNSMLVISKYALDCKEYSSSTDDHVTWETSSLCEWMNSTFLTSAFSEEEQAVLKSRPEEKVFLLSANEAEGYFSTDAERLCKATDYALANDSRVKKETGNCGWWLKSVDRRNGYDHASYVDSHGEINDDLVFQKNFVRPALLINLDF